MFAAEKCTNIFGRQKFGELGKCVTIIVMLIKEVLRGEGKNCRNRLQIWLRIFLNDLQAYMDLMLFDAQFEQ